MKNLSCNLLLIIFSIAFLLITNSCDSTSKSSVERFLYTSSNDPLGNTIIILSIGPDGQLSQIGNMPTGGVGDADDGDFDGQNSLHIVPSKDYLLAVNAGDSNGEPGVSDGNGSISVYKIDNTNGLISRIDQNPATSIVENRDSEGVRPVSISSYELAGKTWVLVGNQYHNPVFFVESREEGVGNTRPGDPEGEIVETDLRNVVAYEFVDGILLSPRTVTIYADGQNGGPANIAFSPDGSKVAVSTWGVPHFDQEGLPDQQVQLPSRVYFYDVSVSGNSFDLVNERFFELEGIAGTIGFSWSPDSEFVFRCECESSTDSSIPREFWCNCYIIRRESNLVGSADVPPFGDAACGFLDEADSSPFLVPSAHPGGNNVSPESQAFLGLVGY